jgi:hypothetical protein
LHQTTASILTDLDEWTKGVFFPVAVFLISGLLIWVGKCLKALLNEFRATKAEVQLNTAATSALETTLTTEVARLDSKLDEIKGDARERIEQVAADADRAHDRIDDLLQPGTAGHH